MVTVSLIKADVGGYPGHSGMHPELVSVGEKELEKARKKGILIDFRVLACDDDLQLLMTHGEGSDSERIHTLAWNAFKDATEKAKELKLYGAGQDLLSEAFSGNIRGMGPGIAEMEFTERKAEPLIAFMMDKTEPGAFNLPIFKMFADPFNTAGLVIDPHLHNGFVLEIWDIQEHRKVFMNAPEELYDILALIGAKSRYVIKRVFPKEGSPLSHNEPVAAISTEKLYQIAHKYVGKDDPVALVRAQSGLPALGEVLEAFAFPHLVSGWMRGSHNGPIMPVSFKHARCTRFDGPPRVIAAGFQVSNG
ncbi:MAG TPA: fructose 1,6-bisphosphatase, partial [Archaeoglobaceae archaeon]|nr:fructose 1,6-bisphosphatase [Archaeoglobaceae archaeon]